MQCSTVIIYRLQFKCDMFAAYYFKYLKFNLTCQIALIFYAVALKKNYKMTDNLIIVFFRLFTFQTIRK